MYLLYQIITSILHYMLVTKSIEIDMGHRVPNHKSKCRNPHGHRYKIEVGVDDYVTVTPGKSSEGMVIDYGDLKEAMIQKIDVLYDHSFTVSNDDLYVPVFEKMRTDGLKINFVNFVPTAENLAKHWYGLMKEELKVQNIKIHHVTVWETPTSTATYEEA